MGKKLSKKEQFEIHESKKFSILMDQLKGEYLSNVIYYWCIANNINTDNLDLQIIDQKSGELLKVMQL